MVSLEFVLYLLQADIAGCFYDTDKAIYFLSFVQDAFLFCNSASCAYNNLYFYFIVNLFLGYHGFPFLDFLNSLEDFTVNGVLPEEEIPSVIL